MEVASNSSNLTPEQFSDLPAAFLKTQFSSFGELTDEVLGTFSGTQLYSLAYSDFKTPTSETKNDISELRTTKATLERYLEDTKVILNISSYEKNGRPSSLDEVLDDYIEWCQNNGVNKEYYRTGVDSALRSIKRSVYQQVVTDTWASIKGETNHEIFDQFLSYFSFNEAECIAIKWWLCDTKRRLRDLAEKSTVDASAQVPYPVFYGGQGIGKTYICRELRKPLGELSAPDKVSSMMDEFNQRKYGLMLVSDLDDISKVADRDLANLKTFATTDVLNPRKMRSEECHYIKKITTVICSSNDPIHEVIPDTTGARRFFQIEVPSTGYIEPIKQTDFLKLWQAVDIDWEPSTEEHKLILDSQSEQRKRDVVEVWWEENYEYSIFGKETTASRLFESFDTWREQSKHMQVTQTTFGNKVAKFLSDKIEKKRKKHGNVYIRLTPEPAREPLVQKEIKFGDLNGGGYSV